VRERDARTNRRTKRQVPADAHITIYLGNRPDFLLLQGHLFVLEYGKRHGDCHPALETAYPIAVMSAGQRRILQDQDRKAGYTLDTAPTAEYWGMNGSCGFLPEKRHTQRGGYSYYGHY
jgi:hypothetical protein